MSRTRHIGPATVEWDCHEDNTWDDPVTDGPYAKGKLYYDGAYQDLNDSLKCTVREAPASPPNSYRP